MSGLDHDTYRQWLDLEVEGELADAESRRLGEHLAGCTACREERGRLVSLRSALAEARIPVRQGFARAVMAALPAPAWQTRRRPLASRADWGWAAALLVLLGGLSAALLLAGGGGDALPAAGALAALADLAGAALVAGAGLLGASWAGVGLALGELLARSPGTAVGLGLAVVLLALLAASLLRRPRASEARAEHRRR